MNINKNPPATTSRRISVLQGILFCFVVGVGLGTILPIFRSPTSHLSYDSIRYLAGAEAILFHGRYESDTGLVSPHWPPGTSLAYAGVARLFSRSPESLVPMINCSSYVLLAIALYLLLNSLQLPVWLRLLVFTAVLLNIFLTSMYNRLWSEPLFLPFWIACMASLVSALPCATGRGDTNFGTEALTKDSRLWLLPLSSALLGVACLFRYAAVAGIPIVACVTALILWRRRRTVAIFIMAIPAAFALPILFGWLLAGLSNLSSAPRQFSFLVTAPHAVVLHALEGFGILADQIVPAKRLSTLSLVPLAFL